MDNFLQPAVSRTFTYIRDTSDFISKIEQLKIPNEAVFMTADVQSLYTNIDHERARSVVEKVLLERSQQDPPSYTLLELTDICLENNYFRFLNEFYVQIKGVVMGSAFAPSIANLVMSDFENSTVLDRNFNPSNQI